MTLSRFEAERFRYLILAAQRLGSRQLNEYMNTIDLTPSQSEVIQILNQWQPLSLKDLGTFLVCETGSPSRLVDRMVKEGLIDKIVDPSDARYVLLQLTELGMEKSKKIHIFEEQIRKDLEMIFNDEELSLVSATLEKMLLHFPIAETLLKRNLMKSPSKNMD
ncbi:Multiple antibiotic resistance protein MarR [compost metagenome]